MTVTVLYLGGAGRSGTTLLERMLSQSPGTIGLGEVVHLGVRGLGDDERCGCGEPFSTCASWTKVGAVAFGGWNQIDGNEWRRLQASVDRNRQLPLLFAPLFPGFRRRLRRHAAHLSAVYRAAAEVGGADVVIDSSKHASTAFLLRHVPGIEVCVVHMVRDSRGVAHSWTKEIERPEVRDEPTLMPRFHPAMAAAWWLFFNAAFHVVGWLGTRRVFLRYEDLVNDPRRELTRVLLAAGKDDEQIDLSFLDEGGVRLGTDHLVAGNPMRFRTGRIDLRRDEAWRTDLAPSHRRIVTALTAPLLAAYGYLRSPRS
ncbi:sulfotransferase [soil metagenome]